MAFGGKVEQGGRGYGGWHGRNYVPLRKVRLGFKDLKKFNVAMLSKQGWRLINDSNPMVTRIMKARYYPHSDFLNAQIGENPSYMWRSIIAGQEVLKQGCRRSIGTGEDTFVWKVPWLPSAGNGYITTNMPLELEDTKVVNLMRMHDRGWDDEVLQDIFNDSDIQQIKRIPLSNVDKKDSWLWLFDGKGEFTVKSCYRHLVGECDTTDATFWKKVWNLLVPGKVKVLIWRVCRSCLPTTTVLSEKRVNIERKCSWCQRQDEDTNHVLFECSFARQVWDSVNMTQWIQRAPDETIFALFKRLFATGTQEQCALLALVCWNLWNRRNKWVWDKIEVSVFGIKNAAMNLLSDWKAAQVQDTRHRASIHSSVRSWQRPQTGWVKVNLDAAVFASISVIGVGGVIRDETGHLLRAMCKQIPGSWSPREAEALSLKEVLSWVKNCGFTRCIFETDSKLLADACQSGTGRSYFHSIVSECVELLKHFDRMLVQFVHRSANGVAHALARVSHSMSGLQEWKYVPNFLSDAITFDLI